MGTTVSTRKVSVSLNGIDATTGGPYGAALSPEDFANSILHEQVDADLAKALAGRVRAAKLVFGVRPGVNARSLAEAGWGAIFPMGCPPEIISNLQRLLDRRAQEAGPRFRVFKGSEGYRPGDSNMDFLKREGILPGPANPDK